MGRGGGKKQHSKDKMYLLQSEWQHEGGGYAGGVGARNKLPFRKLPYDCCALSLAPFQDPMMSPKGCVFDMLNIIPYVNKHKKCPVTGEKLAMKDLVKLNFTKNDKGEYHCPVMYKTFSPHTSIVAIKTTGNVYCQEAVEQLNFKAKNFKDLLTDQPFTRADVITLQDPQGSDNREIAKFEHIVKQETFQEAKQGELNVTEETKRILSKAGLNTTKSGGDTKPGQVRLRGGPGTTSSNPDEKKKKGISNGMMAASFTSTAIEVHTKVEEIAMTDKEKRMEIYAIMRKIGKKGYVQFKTTAGDINLEVRCDCTPMTAENFLTLCKRGYYNGTIFHRVIKGFMMQGGDPTGTGRGGESIWKDKFEDEFDSRLTHNARGILSMANSGSNTNGSQFFITFKEVPHLNNKHTVFGSVVGGLETLNEVEHTQCDSRDRPAQDIRVLETTVFVNPFDTDLPAYLEQQKEKEEEEKQAKALKRKREVEDAEGGKDWFSNPAAAATMKTTAYKDGIGKYIAPPPAKAPAIKDAGKGEGKGGGKGEGEGVAAIPAASAAAPASAAKAAGKDDGREEDLWANAVPVAKPKIQPKSTAKLNDFSGW